MTGAMPLNPDGGGSTPVPDPTILTTEAPVPFGPNVTTRTCNAG